MHLFVIEMNSSKKGKIFKERKEKVGDRQAARRNERNATDLLESGELNRLEYDLATSSSSSDNGNDPNAQDVYLKSVCQPLGDNIGGNIFIRNCFY